jgi:membrane protein
MPMSAVVDEYQRRHRWVGIPLAVIYKFVDDQGGYLSALITYYGFLSLFPLFLIVASVLGFVLHGDPHLQTRLLGSTLTQFPIVGKEIQSNIHEYTGSGAALVVGILGTIYGSLGVAQAAQNAMNVVWAVPRHKRPNPIKSRLRSLLILATLGGGVLITTALSAASSGNQAFGLHLGIGGRVVTVLIAVALNTALFVVAYQLLTISEVSRRQVLLGAVVAGLAWQGLQSLGTYYIAHRLKGAQEVYGVFGVVLGLIAWIYIEAVIVVICAELNVVLSARLWPRSLLTPFTDNVRLTDADKTAYSSYAGAQKFKGKETIDVDFPHDQPADHSDEKEPVGLTGVGLTGAQPEVDPDHDRPPDR